jgi:hypothetical protein
VGELSQSRLACTCLVTRRLGDDWRSSYSYSPVLLETFFEKPRFLGTSYKVANWLYLGDTQDAANSIPFIGAVSRSRQSGLAHDSRRRLCQP